MSQSVINELRCRYRWRSARRLPFAACIDGMASLRLYWRLYWED